jgi:hypothetical protein
MNQFGITFGNQDYWDVHGLWFLVFITAFPRLTMLFSSVASGGILWWLSWLFAPRLLAAFLATVAYWNTNKALVVIAWLVAWGGESGEKYVVTRQVWKTPRQST